MKVWIITIGEPIPIKETKGARLLRSGYLSLRLADRGHHVCWWTSAFDHSHKRHIVAGDTHINFGDRLDLKLLRTCGYSKNVSLRRLYDHWRLARKFTNAIELESAPDVIVVSAPPIELCQAAIEFGKRHGIPVIIDVRDLWPDIFIHLLPKGLQWLGRLMARPFFSRAGKVFTEATAITGITEAFVDWGLSKGNRVRTEMDRAFAHAYSNDPPASRDLMEAESFWDQHGIKTTSDSLRMCFVGYLGLQFDLAPVFEAVKALDNRGVSVKLIIAGTGTNLEKYKHLAGNNENILFPGWINAAQIFTLMRRCDVGLDPLPNRFDFLMTINNKAIEYLSAGLPVISSPDKGALRDLLIENGCGYSYPQGDSVTLANLLMELHNDRDLLQRMSNNAAALFEDCFTTEKVYGDFIDHMEKIVKLYN